MATPPPFDSLERAVIQIGKRDPIANRRSRGRLLWLIQVIFGFTPPRPLANPRLEALRTLVIAIRRNGKNPPTEVGAALRVGITQQQIDYLFTECRPAGRFLNTRRDALLGSVVLPDRNGRDLPRRWMHGGRFY
jgi:hypothetical protein